MLCCHNNNFLVEIRIMPASIPALLLVNLGTPDAPTPAAVRRYLREFLSDPRVVEVPRLIWLPLLHGVILPFRAKRSAHAYQQIWDREHDCSPLLAITRAQAQGLQQRLGDGARVDFAMRYGNPALGERLRALHEAGHERIVILPLYPQYSGSTVASVVDEVARVLGSMRHQPAVRIAAPYYDEPFYIEALKRRAEAHLASLEWVPEVILLSYHGVPKAFVDRGDPYAAHCEATTAALRRAMGMDATRMPMSYQSRLGRAEWLQPYTEDTIRKLAEQGVKKLAVMTPAFAADCLETLEEIAIGGAETFRAHGGEQFTLIPCLNASGPGLGMLEALARRELAGWLPAAGAKRNENRRK